MDPTNSDVTVHSGDMSREAFSSYLRFLVLSYHFPLLTHPTHLISISLRLTRHSGSNMSEFHTAFGILPGDTMFRTPAQRVDIW
jgi:hypothetical protein